MARITEIPIFSVKIHNCLFLKELLSKAFHPLGDREGTDKPHKQPSLQVLTENMGLSQFCAICPEMCYYSVTIHHIAENPR